MSVWLIIEAELYFNEKLRPITNAYRGDLLAEGAQLHYGMHFLNAPASIRPGEYHKIQMLLRAYPEDKCADFQTDKKIFLKEGTLTRAEGIVLRRFEQESSAKSILEFIRTFEAQSSQ